MLARAKNYGKMKKSLIEINITKSLIILHKVIFSVTKIHSLDNINPTPVSNKVHIFLDHANIHCVPGELTLF